MIGPKAYVRSTINNPEQISLSISFASQRDPGSGPQDPPDSPSTCLAHSPPASDKVDSVKQQKEEPYRLYCPAEGEDP
jgi:hypothetical protein